MQIDFTSENKAYSVHETGLEKNKHSVYEVTGVRNQHSLYVGGTTKLMELIETKCFVSVSQFMHRLLEEMNSNKPILEQLISDNRALDMMTEYLSSSEWSSETIEGIAEILQKTGRIITDEIDEENG